MLNKRDAKLKGFTVSNKYAQKTVCHRLSFRGRGI